MDIFFLGGGRKNVVEKLHLVIINLMYWSVVNMGLQTKINGKTVERAYEDYRNGIYLVNRRYQRKLVWNISEKEAFIDS